MYHKKWFQSLIAAILIVLLIYLLSIVDFIFHPIMTYIGAIAFPIIASGVLYYITRPIVMFLQRRKVPKVVGILIVFSLLTLVIYFIINYIAPIAQVQFTRFVNNVPNMIGAIEELFLYWQANQGLFPEQLNEAVKESLSYVEKFTLQLTTIFLDAIAQVVQFLFLLVLVPFFLFYLLKDGDKLIPFLTQFFSKEKGNSLKRLLKSVDHTLSSFIQGQLLVSLCVGILLYIGYLIIGLNYSLTLALFGLLTNVIPFLGPYLAVIPAILVAVFQDPTLVIYVVIIMIVAQQIEGNLISPNIMGKALNLHPLTIITLILAAGSIAGFIGLLFVIPFYAVIKTITIHFYKEWKQ